MCDKIDNQSLTYRHNDVATCAMCLAKLATARKRGRYVLTTQCLKSGLVCGELVTQALLQHPTYYFLVPCMRHSKVLVLGNLMTQTVVEGLHSTKIGISHTVLYL